MTGFGGLEGGLEAHVDALRARVAARQRGLYGRGKCDLKKLRRFDELYAKLLWEEKLLGWAQNGNGEPETLSGDGGNGEPATR